MRLWVSIVFVVVFLGIGSSGPKAIATAAVSVPPARVQPVYYWHGRHYRYYYAVTTTAIAIEECTSIDATTVPAGGTIIKW
jgi:hypothetical protein